MCVYNPSTPTIRREAKTREATGAYGSGSLMYSTESKWSVSNKVADEDQFSRVSSDVPVLIPSGVSVGSAKQHCPPEIAGKVLMKVLTQGLSHTSQSCPSPQNLGLLAFIVLLDKTPRDDRLWSSALPLPTWGPFGLSSTHGPSLRSFFLFFWGLRHTRQVL